MILFAVAAFHKKGCAMINFLLVRLGLIKKPGLPELKVLIIEDNPVDSKMIRQTVDICGYTPLVAYDGKTGLAMAKAHKPALIVLDYYLPDQDGGSILKALRADPKTARLKVLMLTVSDQSSVIVEAFGDEEEVDEYYHKPISMTRLAESILELVEEEKA